MMNKVKHLEKLLKAETKARIRAEELLLHKTEELEKINNANDTNTETGDTKNQSIKQKAKFDFLENISHEIRTPLTAIIGFTENLKDSTLNKEESSSALNTIYRNAQNLLNIINDILEARTEKTEEEENNHHETYFIEILNDLEEEFFPKAKDKGLTFSIKYALPIPIHIISNAKKLTKVLNHIIHNAIKFTEKGQILIEVKYISDLKQLKISVIDSGIGVSDSQKENLFQPFSQEDASASRKYGGAGLGLFVSKQLIESINGTLELTDSTNQGSCFSITIEVEEKKVPKWIEKEKELNAFQHTLNEIDYIPKLYGKVLLAEDALDNQQLIEMYVDATGASIDIVENGQQAVENAMSKNYDLIIMDIQMPIMDGISATEMLRMTGYSRPIIALSANIVKGDAHKYLSIGFNHYLPKPINKTHFFKALAGYLNQEEISTRSKKAQSIQNSSAYKKITESFIAGLPKITSAIKTDLEEENWSEFSRKIHSLKGSGGTFGYHEITNCCTKIEEQLEAQDYIKTINLLKELESCIANITQAN